MAEGNENIVSFAYVAKKQSLCTKLNLGLMVTLSNKVTQSRKLLQFTQKGKFTDVPNVMGIYVILWL